MEKLESNAAMERYHKEYENTANSITDDMRKAVIESTLTNGLPNTAPDTQETPVGSSVTEKVTSYTQRHPHADGIGARGDSMADLLKQSLALREQAEKTPSIGSEQVEKMHKKLAEVNTPEVLDERIGSLLRSLL